MTLTYRLSLPGRGDTELRGLPCHPATLPPCQPHTEIQSQFRGLLQAPGKPSSIRVRQGEGVAAAPSPGTSLRGWCCLLPPAGESTSRRRQQMSGPSSTSSRRPAVTRQTLRGGRKGGGSGPAAGDSHRRHHLHSLWGRRAGWCSCVP